MLPGIYPHFGSNKLLTIIFKKKERKRQLYIKMAKILCVGVFAHMEGMTTKVGVSQKPYQEFKKNIITK